MFTLIILSLIVIGTGYFATINTETITINFGYNKIGNIPLYITVLAPLFIGLFSAWIFNLKNDLEHKHVKKRMKVDFNDARNEIAELTRRVHKLELENTRLKAETGKSIDEDSI